MCVISSLLAIYPSASYLRLLSLDISMTYVERLDSDGASPGDGHHHHHHHDFPHAHAHAHEQHPHSYKLPGDASGSGSGRASPHDDEGRATEPMANAEYSSDGESSSERTALLGNTPPTVSPPVRQPAIANRRYSTLNLRRNLDHHYFLQPAAPMRKARSYSAIPTRRAHSVRDAAVEAGSEYVLSAEPFFTGHHRYELPIAHARHSSRGWRLHFFNVRDAVLRLVPYRTVSLSVEDPAGAADTIVQRVPSEDTASDEGRERDDIADGDEGNALASRVDRRKQVVSILVCCLFSPLLVCSPY